MTISTINAQSNKLTKALQQVLNKTLTPNKIFGTCFAIKSDSFSWEGHSGNFQAEEPYFIASTTKLFTSALIFQLTNEKLISFSDPISIYFDSNFLSGLHKFKKKDYSNTITIGQLLSHTSGLPDYFQDKNNHGISLENHITSGLDQSWTFEEAIARTKKLPAKFIPGTKGKAHYSDINFQILGRIIAIVTHKSYEENLSMRIFQPLGLTQTYVFSDSNDTTPKNLYYKSKPLIIPKAMSSFTSDGGIVSNTKELLIFTEAFFTGKLFPIEFIKKEQTWNPIFFPMKSGRGMHQFKLPWIFNPTGSIPAFIGHSGLSGALAYCVPEQHLYIVGTVNQVAHPDISFKTMLKLYQSYRKYHKH